MSVCLFVYLLCLFVETVSTTKRNGLIDIDRPIKRATATAAAATASAEAVAAVSKKKKNYHGWLIEILRFILEELKIMAE